MLAVLRRLPFAVMLLLSLLVAVFSFRFLMPEPPVASPDVLGNAFANPFLPMHAGLAALALLLGPFQFIGRRDGRRARWHRMTGAVYVAACLISAPAGLMLALGTTAGPIATAGFGLLAVAWFYTTGQGLLSVLGGRYAEHRRWMIRSFALTLAAVTLRLYLPIAPLTGHEFMPAYVAISWLCWVPNLILAELFFVPRRAVSPALRAA